MEEIRLDNTTDGSWAVAVEDPAESLTCESCQ